MNDTFIPKKERKLPIPCAVLYAVALTALILHILFYRFPAFADRFNLTVGAFFRAVFAHITGLLPFSLAEAVLLCLPVALVLLVVFCVHTLNHDSGTRSMRLICTLLAVLCALYSAFVFLFASAYRGKSLDQKLSLETTEVSAGQLASTARYFLELANAEADQVTFTFGGASVMPYSLDRMIDLLNDAYAKVNESCDFVQKLRAPVKYVALSGPMTYTHISGVYTYYTGEANININFPDYTLPYTAAHEMSHQRGIAPENEANFMAFLVCAASDDAYIRYSGYMNMYEYLLNALYTADRTLYYELWNQTDIRLQCEEISYSEFFSRYSENAVATASNAVNDTYLKVQGQSAGTRSYGMVVDLAVAYAESRNKSEGGT